MQGRRVRPARTARMRLSVEEVQPQLPHKVEPVAALPTQIDIDRVPNVAEQYQGVPSDQQERKIPRLGSLNDPAQGFLHRSTKS
jgi:hypothetical protein